MTTSKQLQAALNKNQLERISLQNELDDLQKKKELPQLKKKYDGKFFKYRNSAGPNDHWYIYVFCEKVVSVNRAICLRVECDNQGEWTFSTSHETGLWLFQEEISQNEFDKAALQFISAAQTIMQLK